MPLVLGTIVRKSRWHRLTARDRACENDKPLTLELACSELVYLQLFQAQGLGIVQVSCADFFNKILN